MATLYVSQNRLKKNVNNIKKKLNDNVKIIAMIKANAYGMGDVGVAKILEENGIDFFGVALVKEAKHLRENNIKSKILVTSQFLEEDIDTILNYDVTVSLSDLNLARILNEHAKEEDKKVKVHIKLDTGMTRLGFSLEKLVSNVEYIKTNYSNLEVEGMYTHLSSADSSEEYTKKQLAIFKSGVEALKENNINLKYIHCLNSAGTIQEKYKEYQYTHVRVGDIIYGYYPDESLKKEIDIKPVGTFKAKILQLRVLEEDSFISYNRTSKMKKGAVIATIQIGYADGFRRELSNKHYVFYKGTKCEIVGNICMDMCMIDITNVENAKVGEEVEIFGEYISVDYIADKLNTINYEIISTISSRVDKIYII